MNLYSISTCTWLLFYFQNADLALADLTISFAREQDIDFTKPFMDLGMRFILQVSGSCHATHQEHRNKTQWKKKTYWVVPSGGRVGQLHCTLSALVHCLHFRLRSKRTSGPLGSLILWQPMSGHKFCWQHLWLALLFHSSINLAQMITMESSSTLIAQTKRAGQHLHHTFEYTHKGLPM